MAHPGVIPHWRSPCALVLPSSSGRQMRTRCERVTSRSAGYDCVNNATIREGQGTAAEGIRLVVRDSLCTGAQEVGPSGWCGGCGDPPLRVRRQQCFCVDPSQRPSHKTHTRGHRMCGLTHALHHILCSTHVHRAQVQPHDVSQQCHSVRAGFDCRNNTTSLRRLEAVGWAPHVCTGPLTTSLRGLWVSGLLPPGNGGTNEGAATLKPTKRPRGLTHNSRAGIPKRLRPNCHNKEVLSNQRGLQQRNKWSKSHDLWRRGATGFCVPQKITVVTA